MKITSHTSRWLSSPDIHSSKFISEVPTTVSLISRTTCDVAEGTKVVTLRAPRACNANDQLGHPSAITQHRAIHPSPTLMRPTSSWYPNGSVSLHSWSTDSEVDTSHHSSSAFFPFPFPLFLSRGSSNAAQALSARLST